MTEKQCDYLYRGGELCRDAPEAGVHKPKDECEFRDCEWEHHEFRVEELSYWDHPEIRRVTAVTEALAETMDMTNPMVTTEATLDFLDQLEGLGYVVVLK